MSIDAWEGRFNEVTSSHQTPIIAEIKHYTPDKGDLLRGRDIKKIAEDYTAAGAACISVVTGKWFGGSLSMLESVATATHLPILRKDLIVTTGQIKQSKALGATAVLLTKKVLSVRQLNNMIDTCHQLDMCPFIEVSTIQELNAIESAANAIIAITNRDISQKEQDHASGLKSLALVQRASERFKTLVSASGIKNANDANNLIEHGFNALLVGTSLLTADCPRLALSRMVQSKEAAATHQAIQHTY